MKHFKTLSLVLLALLLLPLQVFAAEAATQQQWWQVLLSELLTAFVAIAVPVLSTLIVVLLRRWKIKLEYDQVSHIAGAAAAWAEQKAQVALKDGKDKTPGAEKMQLALTFAKEMATKYKLPEKATEKLQDLIESKLGEKKVG